MRALSLPSRSRVALTLALVGLAAGSVVAVSTASSAQAQDRASALRSAAAYGPKNSYKIGIAVYDTKRHKVYGSGSYKSTFASESVVKAMIATRLIVQGRMHGSTARRAYKMITQSDDAIASSFYGSVGGDGLINWVKRHYHVPDLGSPPHRAGWWGNTHITPIGLVKFYAKVKSDRKVGPWLLNAMHHARPYGSDGTYQFFGIPSATKGFAVKQGWGNDYEVGSSADFNTTGFVNHYRYAVAILARGPSSSYGSRISALLTQVARRVLPNGVYPAPIPGLSRVTPQSTSTVGGKRITITGTNFTHVTAVRFGTVNGRDVKVLSPTKLTVTAPQHARSYTYVHVVTTHGETVGVKAARFLFERPPAITGMSAHSGRTAGGGSVLLTGAAFTQPVRVLFGTTPAARVTRLSRERVQAVAPQHAAGTVNVHVVTAYGKSPDAAADRYTFFAPPTITSISPAYGPASGGNTVVITGTSFPQGATVSFGGTQASSVQRDSATELEVTVPPASDPGTVDVVVSGPFGSVTDPHAYTYS